MLKMLGATLRNLVWAPMTISLVSHKQYYIVSMETGCCDITGMFLSVLSVLYEVVM